MKKAYRNLLRFFIGLPVKIEIMKTIIFEWIAILRKSKLYKHIKWTNEQQEEFEHYWKLYYGKKISNRWHKLYQSFNGVFCVEYIPEILFSTKIEPKLNNYNYCRIYADKNLMPKLYSDKENNVRMPKTYLASCGRYLYDGEGGKVITEKAAYEKLYNIGAAIIKPTVATSSGNGIQFVDICNGIDKGTGKDIRTLLESYQTNFVVQEKIIPHSAFEKIYSGSVNTIRIVTYICDGSINCAPASMRMGGKGSITDNIHAGGAVIGIDGNGILKERAFRLGYGDNMETFLSHPDSGTCFKGYTVPKIREIKDTACRLHGKTPNVGMISWDFTVNTDNELIIIEANYWGQSVWFPQIVNGIGFFQDQTESMLRIAREKKSYS